MMKVKIGRFEWDENGEPKFIEDPKGDFKISEYNKGNKIISRVDDPALSKEVKIKEVK